MKKQFIMFVTVSCIYLLSIPANFTDFIYLILYFPYGLLLV